MDRLVWIVAAGLVAACGGGGGEGDDVVFACDLRLSNGICVDFPGSAPDAVVEYCSVGIVIEDTCPEELVIGRCTAAAANGAPLLTTYYSEGVWVLDVESAANDCEHAGGVFVAAPAG